MPITPTAWGAWYGQDAHTSYGVGAWYGQDAHTSYCVGAWYGQDAHTSYGVGCVVWAGCPYLLIYEHNFKQNIWQRKRRSAKPLILKKQ